MLCFRITGHKPPLELRQVIGGTHIQVSSLVIVRQNGTDKSTLDALVVQNSGILPHLGDILGRDFVVDPRREVLLLGRFRFEDEQLVVQLHDGVNVRRNTRKLLTAEHSVFGDALGAGKRTKRIHDYIFQEVTTNKHGAVAILPFQVGISNLVVVQLRLRAIVGRAHNHSRIRTANAEMTDSLPFMGGNKAAVNDGLRVGPLHTGLGQRLRFAVEIALEENGIAQLLRRQSVKVAILCLHPLEHIRCGFRERLNRQQSSDAEVLRRLQYLHALPDGSHGVDERDCSTRVHPHGNRRGEIALKIHFSFSPFYV